MSGEEFLCNNCGIVHLATSGRCERCNSDQVVPLLAGAAEEMVKQ